MRNMLRFTPSLPHEPAAIPDVPLAWGIAQHWTTFQKGDTSDINNCIESIHQTIHFKLDSHVALAKERLRVGRDLRAGLAWITSQPVKEWYNGLNEQAQSAFSAWVVYLRKLAERLAPAVGPFVTVFCLVWFYKMTLDKPKLTFHCLQLAWQPDAVQAWLADILFLKMKNLRRNSVNKIRPFPGSKADPNKKDILRHSDFHAFLQLRLPSVSPKLLTLPGITQITHCQPGLTNFLLSPAS